MEEFYAQYGENSYIVDGTIVTTIDKSEPVPKIEIKTCRNGRSLTIGIEVWLEFNISLLIGIIEYNNTYIIGVDEHYEGKLLKQASSYLTNSEDTFENKLINIVRIITNKYVNFMESDFVIPTTKSASN